MPAEEEFSVSPLELFFDLVFVFAFTQVTALLADDLTWTGMVRGTAVLVVVWWAWVGYSLADQCGAASTTTSGLASWSSRLWRPGW